MSARLENEVRWQLRPRFALMRPADVQAIAAIETALYSFPWTAGNFRDSLAAGYSSWVLREDGGEQGEGPIVGYFLMMAALDEAHLLNISVALAHQGRGFGLALLNKATETAREHRARSMILEVRPSNLRALQIYERYGFRRIGLRRGYYPISTQNRTDREDAIVMQIAL
ncbi:MAG: ribosomal protein S18-alanine N-acetyltransferase [Burkholderiaceae bacterium]|jgi:ribosomal-protein-alanine N-acetyltransferase